MFHFPALIWDILVFINITSMLLLSSLKYYIGNKDFKIDK